MGLRPDCRHHHERNHQGKDNLLLFPEPAIAQTVGLEGAIQCRERLGGCSVSTIGKPHEYLDPTGSDLAIFSGVLGDGEISVSVSEILF